jgi:hypothetical protein
LQDGQLVTFSEVVGMAELNSHKPVKVKNCKVRRLCWCTSQSQYSAAHQTGNLCGCQLAGGFAAISCTKRNPTLPLLLKVCLAVPSALCQAFCAAAATALGADCVAAQPSAPADASHHLLLLLLLLPLQTAHRLTLLSWSWTPPA